MLDIRLLRENPEIVKKDLEKRQIPEQYSKVEKTLKLDEKRRKLIQQRDSMKAERNTASKLIGEMKKKGKKADSEIARMKELSDRIAEYDAKAEKAEADMRAFLMNMPNILHESVPVGKDDTENVQVKTRGKQKFDFTPKNHFDLMTALGLMEGERAAKIAGRGFFYLKNELALLDYALMRYAAGFLMKRGFTLIEPPYMMNRKAYEGVTDLSDFETVMYKIQDDDLYLIATSEHPMGAMLMDEVIEKKDLPLKLCGISPCFRREVGSHGKYTKGLFRMHQFNKIEQFVFCLPEDSWKIHEELQKNAEDIFRSLEIPFRVVNVCTGDIGTVAAKKYDTEALMGDGVYREIISNSNCTDYQARRLNIKWREKAGAAPEGFVHTLNGTAMATSRGMIALIENHQQKDGSVRIPEVLRPYMNRTEFIGKKDKSVANIGMRFNPNFKGEFEKGKD